MKRWLVLVCLSIVTLGASAQRLIEGYVFDGETKQPVEGAAVLGTSTSTNGVVTDSTGWFSIRTNDKSLTVKHLLYDDYNVVLSKFSNGMRIFLSPAEATLLNQTVIGADKIGRTMKEQIVSVEVVQPKLIEDKNPIQIDEIVNQVSGVVVSDGQINIRNGAGWSYGTGSRALVVVDGMPLLSGDAGSVQWNFITPDNIRSMEVVKGASSVLYGSSALNGLINIQSAWPSSKPKTSATLFAGMYSKPSRETLDWSDKSLYNSGLRFFDSRRFGKTDLVTNVSLIDEQGYREGDFDQRTHIGFDFRRRVKPGLNFGIRTHLLSTSNGSFLLWQSYDSGYSALDHQITTTKGTKIRIDPFLNYVTKKGWQHKLKSRVFSLNNRVDNGDPNNDQSNKSLMYYADYQSAFRMFGALKITYGATLISTKTQSPLFNGDQKASNRAIYIQIDQKFKRFSYTLGRRWENYALNDYKESKPVLRAGVNVHLGKATYLRASYGEGFRFPTIAESYISTQVGKVSIYPNEVLRSETGDNTEIGVKQGFKNKHIQGYLDIAAFRMRYQNMMEFNFSQWSSDISIDNGLGLGFKSINTGDNTIKGLDISTLVSVKALRGKIQLFGGYTTSLPQSDNPNAIFATDSTGNELSYTSTSWDTTNAVLKYRSLRTFKMDVSYSRRRWDGGVSMRYSSRIQNIDKAFVTVFQGLGVTGIEESFNLNPKGVWVTDIRLGYRFTSKYRLAVIVNNVQNKEYVVRPADIAAPRFVMVQLKAVI